MRIAFRTDASVQIGTGHVARCWSLASALRARGAECTFICRHLPSAYQQMLQCEGFGVVRMAPALDDGSYGNLGCSPQQDAEETIAVTSGRRFDWLVVDHYGLDAAWENRMRAIAARILVIDDLANRRHDCDLLLDQNFYIDSEHRYEHTIAPATRALLGPKYALLRADFAAARNDVSARDGNVRRILVFFGGVDAAGYTGAAIDALSKVSLSNVAVDVVVGGSHPFLTDVQRQCALHGYALHVQTTRMAELMARADLALGAGGIATWERCCVGLPTIVFEVADNQQQLVRDAALAGIVYAPDIKAPDPEQIALHVKATVNNSRMLAGLSSRGMSLVDGNGTRRVLHAMGLPGVAVRPAAHEDIRNMYEWRNHPDVRNNSRTQAAIDWPTHLAWTRDALQDPSKIVLIGEQDGQAVGVVRFDIGADAAEVSIYLVPGLAGRGTGSDLLGAAEDWLTRAAPGVAQLNAEVLGGNDRSHGLFRRGGYVLASARYSKRLSR